MGNSRRLPQTWRTIYINQSTCSNSFTLVFPTFLLPYNNRYIALLRQYWSAWATKYLRFGNISSVWCLFFFFFFYNLHKILAVMCACVSSFLRVQSLVWLRIFLNSGCVNFSVIFRVLSFIAPFTCLPFVPFFLPIPSFQPRPLDPKTTKRYQKLWRRVYLSSQLRNNSLLM